MIPITSAGLYSRALRSLSEFVPAGYHGRIVQIFLAAKYYGPAIPRVGDGGGVQVNELQGLLDNLYRKNSRADIDGSIAMLFQNNHLVPTGLIGRGLKVPSNIWRNNLGLQKATICYATAVELSDDTFLAAPRLECPHLRPAVATSLRDAKCALNLEPTYRGEDGPKAIRRDPVDNSFAIVSLNKVDHWRNIIAPEGRKLPIVPIVVTLYCDSEIAAGRTELELMDFVRDFNFSADEYHAYFDDSPAHPVNQALQGAFPGMSWDRVPGVYGKVPPAPPRRRGRAARAAGPPDPETLPLVAPRTGPPAGGHWWSAEQAVEKYLTDSGWNVVNRTMQGVGFDLEIWRKGDKHHRYIEVKSSIGQCAPVLTKNEFEAATKYGSRYSLAILENFSPTANLTILWVNDPASLPLRARQVTQYPIPRAIWLRGASADLS